MKKLCNMIYLDTFITHKKHQKIDVWGEGATADCRSSEEFNQESTKNGVNELPLISIIVITYNSSKTVLETLESIYRQTYKNIELIISDDNSSDRTLYVCKIWLKDHSDRFVKTQILTTDKNTGTAGNCNRGCQRAQGEWIKIIAGDDILTDDGINVLVNFALQDEQRQIVCGTVELLGDEQHNYDQMIWCHNQKLPQILNSAEEQYWYLVRRNFLPAMAVMMKKDLWYKVGGFDEDIPLLEDWPMWLKITKSGIMINFTDHVVAQYRLSDSSVRFNNRFSYSIFLFQYKYIYHDLKKFKSLQKKTFLQRKSIISKWFFKIIRRDIRKYGQLW